MDRSSLASEMVAVEDSLEAVNDLFLERGWSDGLPIVPPTEERIFLMLAGTRRPPQQVVATLAPAEGTATVEKIAVNCVMAGCRPDYLPVVIAAVEAMGDPIFNLYGVQTTTNPVTPAFIVNGPIRQSLGLNSSYNCLGQGSRANATIGRALRLVLTNVGGASPGTLDKATHGQPAKYTFCFAENEEESPWESLSVERGLGPGTSAVTALGAGGTIDINDPYCKTAGGFLDLVAGSIMSMGCGNLMHVGPIPLLIFCPEHAALLAGEGYSKAEAKRALYERAAIPLARFPKEVAEGRILRERLSPDAILHPAPSPEEMLFVVAGGSGHHTVFVPTSQAQPVTRPIEE